MENPPVNPSPTIRGKGRPTPRRQLDRDQWVENAINVLSRDGIAGLRIEVIAKRCGVTKGSFYWHFKDRQDLLDAVLERWKEGRIRDIEKMTVVTGGNEQERLLDAVRVYGASRNSRGMSIELAIRDWARRDPHAAIIVESVDLYRLERTRRLFVGCGMSDADAKSRSLLLYACVFGLSLMHYGHFDDNLDDLKQRIADRIALP